uniref:Tumor protein p53-inducible nuclear protein 1-like n=1 Tax=Callorhinchus milii TaxID=7868 RepID=V9LCA0_CALMI|eukprot:gi/632944577/ref/XP_007887581.1/ PREDICTED: tumor protein p53-inducible nuclear protein 1-like isoform X1 [Callorhinchus milii]
MLGKLASFFLNETYEDSKESISDLNHMLYESEEDDWIIVDIQGQQPVVNVPTDPLENLLIEHPSMSVYSLENKNKDSEEESAAEEEGQTPKVIPIVQYVPRRVSAFRIRDSVLEHTNHIHFMQCAKLYVERRKLSCNHLRRQNRARKRYFAKEKHFGHFKQPCQRNHKY